MMDMMYMMLKEAIIISMSPGSLNKNSGLPLDHVRKPKSSYRGNINFD
jgi:hypothetical protein